MARNVLQPERAFPVTAGAPHVRGFWNHDRIIFAMIVALLSPLGAAAYSEGPPLLISLVSSSWGFPSVSSSANKFLAVTGGISSIPPPWPWPS
jgi:hypothetical protein